jgi:hypothetical protein
MLHVHVTSKSAVLTPSLDYWIRNVLIITIKVPYNMQLLYRRWMTLKSLKTIVIVSQF